MSLLEKIWDWIVKSFQPTAIVLGALIACVLLFVLHYKGMVKLPISGDSTAVQLSANLGVTPAIPVVSEPWSVQQATGKKPYAMLSIVQHITIQDIVQNGKKKRQAIFRNHYTMKMLQDISMQSSEFMEYYSTRHENPIEVWEGSERTDSDDLEREKYPIFFEAKKGDIKTILTGSTLTYDFPLKTSQESCMGTMSLRNDQWLWCYPNDPDDGDYIDELLIVVEGKNIKLNAETRDVYHRNKEQMISRLDPMINHLRNSTTNTIKAYKTKVVPGECTALVITWGI